MKGLGSKEIRKQEGDFDPQVIGGLRETTDLGLSQGWLWMEISDILSKTEDPCFLASA